MTTIWKEPVMPEGVEYYEGCETQHTRRVDTMLSSVIKSASYVPLISIFDLFPEKVFKIPKFDENANYNYNFGSPVALVTWAREIAFECQGSRYFSMQLESGQILCIDRQEHRAVPFPDCSTFATGENMVYEGCINDFKQFSVITHGFDVYIGNCLIVGAYGLEACRIEGNNNDTFGYAFIDKDGALYLQSYYWDDLVRFEGLGTRYILENVGISSEDELEGAQVSNISGAEWLALRKPHEYSIFNLYSERIIRLLEFSKDRTIVENLMNDRHIPHGSLAIIHETTEPRHELVVSIGSTARMYCVDVANHRMIPYPKGSVFNSKDATVVRGTQVFKGSVLKTP